MQFDILQLYFLVIYSNLYLGLQYSCVRLIVMYKGMTSEIQKSFELGVLVQT